MNDIVVRSAVGGRCPRRDEFLRELNTAVMLTSGFNLTDLYPWSPLVRWLSRGLREAGASLGPCGLCDRTGPPNLKGS